MNRDARFFFANLGADVTRCIIAAEAADDGRYQDSLGRAYRTLAFLREANRPEAYEEGQLLLRGLEQARSEKTLGTFNKNVNRLMAEYSPLL